MARNTKETIEEYIEQTNKTKWILSHRRADPDYLKMKKTLDELFYAKWELAWHEQNKNVREQLNA